MLETALISLTTFFATVGPVDTAAIFAGMTPDSSAVERRRMAVRGYLIASGILLATALFGETLLAYMGISFAALRTAGGVLLLLIAIDMVFARHSGGTSTTEQETAEGVIKADISVFPLATPLLAGPGAMGAAILLMADTGGVVALQLVVLASMMAVLTLALLLLLVAGQVSRLFGVTGLNVVSRVVGILLAALAVQFVFDGIAESGLVG